MLRFAAILAVPVFSESLPYPDFATAPYPADVVPGFGNEDISQIEQEGKTAVKDLHSEAVSERDANKQLHGELVDEQETASGLNDDISTLYGHNQATSGENEALRKEIENLEEENDGKRTDFSNFEAETANIVADRRSQIENLHYDIADMKSTHATSLGTKQEAHNDGKSQLSTARSIETANNDQISKLTSKLAGINGNTEESNSKCDATNLHADSLDTRNAATDKLHSGAISKLDGQIDVETGILYNKVTTSANLDSDINRKTSQVDILDDWAHTATVLKADRDHWKATHGQDTLEYEAKVQQLSAEIAEAEKEHQADVVALKSEHSAEMKEKDAEISLLGSKIEELTGSHTSAVAELKKVHETALAAAEGVRAAAQTAHDSALKALEGAHSINMADLTAAHSDAVNALQSTHAAVVGSLQGTIADYGAEKAAEAAAAAQAAAVKKAAEAAAAAHAQAVAAAAAAQAQAAAAAAAVVPEFNLFDATTWG